MANVTVSMENIAKTTLWQSNESSYLNKKVLVCTVFTTCPRSTTRRLCLSVPSLVLSGEPLWSCLGVTPGSVSGPAWMFPGPVWGERGGLQFTER